jgi:hypothetical protein
MKLKFKSSIIVLFVFNFASEIIWGYDLIPVNDKNKHWDSIQVEISRITKSDPNSPIGNKIEKFGTIDTKDANSLFPGWKFYGFDYYNYAKNPSDKHKFHLAGLSTTLAVYDSNSAKTFRLYNYEDYEKFLKINKTVINDANDAKLVWGAWCEIQRGGGKDLKIEKVSDNEWKLGIYEYNQTVSEVNGVKNIVKRTHFSRVKTDPNTKQITEWKSLVETSNNLL